ncbi:MAG: type II toxin-antitoxin system Phd/YefM family antitoxin, partial [Beijerinckiaceae bacterium]
KLMTRFSLTDLGNKSGAVTEAAFRGPVTITDRGRPKFVLLTTEDYERLQQKQQRLHLNLDTMTAEELAFFADGLRDPNDKSE